MFGIAIHEILLFAVQMGLAATGAAALWGIILIYRGNTEHHGDECIIFDWLAERLLFVLYGGMLVAGGAWFILSAMTYAHAHVGITLVPTTAEHAAGLSLMWPLFALWLLLSPIGLFVRRWRPKHFHRRLAWFFGMQFVLVALLISFPAWTGAFDERQLFFIGHNFHSILTLGTVIVLDFLFLLSKSSQHLKQHIYPLFPTISKVIFVGLGIELISVALVFTEAIALTPKFFFMTTVIGILLINGMVLAGPLTRKMIRAVSHSDGKLAHRWELVGDVCGTVSVTSWFTITIVDYFQNLTLTYAEMVSIYGGTLAVVLIGHLAWNYVFKGSIPRWYFAWHRNA